MNHLFVFFFPGEFGMSLSSRDVLLLQMDWIWWRKNAEVFLSYISLVLMQGIRMERNPHFFMLSLNL